MSRRRNIATMSCPSGSNIRNIELLAWVEESVGVLPVGTKQKQEKQQRLQEPLHGSDTWGFSINHTIHTHYLKLGSLFCWQKSQNKSNEVHVTFTQTLAAFLPADVSSLEDVAPRFSTTSKHRGFVKHLYNVGPTSSTLVQHCTNVIQKFCVYWELFCVTWSLFFHGITAKPITPSDDRGWKPR